METWIMRFNTVALLTSMLVAESEGVLCFDCGIQITAWNFTPSSDHTEPRLDPGLPAIDLRVRSNASGAPVGLPDSACALRDIYGKYEPRLRHDLRATDHLECYFPRKRLETARLGRVGVSRVVVARKCQRPRARSNCRRG
jgi:hypothetical protein